MTDQSALNYPNIIRYLVGDHVINISVVQVAATLTPRIVRAGRPIEVLVLIQNMSDAAIDVTATLKLPEKDSKGQKARFVAKAERLVIGLESAEVGYLTLPVTTMPNTAVGQNYKISLALKVAPAATVKTKPGRVRDSGGGTELDATQIPEAKREDYERLKGLNYHFEKQSGLMSTGLELTFNVMTGTVGQIADLKPGWTSLWSLKDYADTNALFVKYRGLLKEKVLPQLDRNTILEPLRIHTIKRFAEAGFELKELESVIIAKLLTLILEFSSPKYGGGTQLSAGIYNILPYLDKEDLQPTLKLPLWCGTFLRALHHNPLVAEHPVQAVVKLCYDDLLLDAVTRSFYMIEFATGEAVGTEEEQAEYIQQWVVQYKENKFGLSDVYMPLMMGSLISSDMIVLKDDNMRDMWHQLDVMVNDERVEFEDEAYEDILQLARKLITLGQLKYRHLD